LGIPSVLLNVASELAAFLLRIQNISDLKIGPKVGYPDRFFVVFLVPPDMLG
jgi:hypothetical protein